jgi:hypothetical protein
LNLGQFREYRCFLQAFLHRGLVPRAMHGDALQRFITLRRVAVPHTGIAREFFQPKRDAYSSVFAILDRSTREPSDAYPQTPTENDAFDSN